MNVKKETAETVETNNLSKFAEDAVSRAKQMIEAGKSYSAIKGALQALDLVKDAKEAKELLDELGKVKVERSSNMIQALCDFCESQPRTQKEFYEFIKADGSKSNWKMRSGRDYIRLMANKLHAAAGNALKSEELYPEDDKESKPKTAEKPDNGKDATETVAPKQPRRGRGRKSAA